MEKKEDLEIRSLKETLKDFNDLEIEGFEVIEELELSDPKFLKKFINKIIKLLKRIHEDEIKMTNQEILQEIEEFNYIFSLNGSSWILKLVTDIITILEIKKNIIFKDKKQKLEKISQKILQWQDKTIKLKSERLTLAKAKLRRQLTDIQGKVKKITQ